MTCRLKFEDVSCEAKRRPCCEVHTATTLTLVIETTSKLRKPVTLQPTGQVKNHQRLQWTQGTNYNARYVISLWLVDGAYDPLLGSFRRLDTTA